MRILLTLLAACVAFSITNTAFSWGHLGHATIGAITQQQLKSQEALDFTFSILSEPLSSASTYPDRVRDEDLYSASETDFSPFHFLRVRFDEETHKFAGFDFSEQTAHKIAALAPVLLAHPTRLSLPQKQDLLRYYLHTVQDMHQPLHVSNPHEWGANGCKVWYYDPKLKGYGPYPGKLHSIYDTKIIEDYGKLEHKAWLKKKGIERGGSQSSMLYFSSRPLSRMLQEKLTGQKAKKLKQLAKDINPMTWYEESHALHEKVYLDAASGAEPYHEGDPNKRSYCDLYQGENPEPYVRAVKHAIPRMDEEKAKEALSLIEDRMLLAALRTATSLKSIAKEAECRSTEHVAKKRGHQQYRNGVKDLISVLTKYASEDELREELGMSEPCS